jgi:hypothetical protein
MVLSIHIIPQVLGIATMSKPKLAPARQVKEEPKWAHNADWCGDPVLAPSSPRLAFAENFRNGLQEPIIVQGWRKVWLLHNNLLHNYLLYNSLLYNHLLHNNPLHNAMLHNCLLYNSRLHNHLLYNNPLHNYLLYNNLLYNALFYN